MYVWKEESVLFVFWALFNGFESGLPKDTKDQGKVVNIKFAQNNKLVLSGLHCCEAVNFVSKIICCIWFFAVLFHIHLEFLWYSGHLIYQRSHQDIYCVDCFLDCSFNHPTTGNQALKVTVRMLLESLQHDSEEIFRFLSIVVLHNFFTDKIKRIILTERTWERGKPRN